jgi:peptide deformylase
MIIRISSALILLMSALSCSTQTGNFTDEELTLIHKSDSIMRMLTIDSYEDSLVLRTPCTDLSAEALLSPDYEELCSLMVATVTHPSQDGVGIAGPQVGLNRRVVAVQRFDKEGEPFEVYPNIRIVWASDSLAYGPEGCLSVPDRRSDVLRSQEIVVEYADIRALAAGRAAEGQYGRTSEGHKHSSGSSAGHMRNANIPMVRDTVRGFTAVIFQHEVDNLDGILYIDRL